MSSLHPFFNKDFAALYGVLISLSLISVVIAVFVVIYATVKRNDEGMLVIKGPELVSYYNEHRADIRGESACYINVVNNLTTKIVSNLLNKEAEVKIDKSENVKDDMAETQVGMNIKHNYKERNEGTDSLNDYGYTSKEVM